MLHILFSNFRDKWMLSIKVFFMVVVPGLFVQYFIRTKGWDILDMNIIIASLLTGAVFLIGFMLAGILQDFKESEQILGAVSNSILSFQDHNRTEPNVKKRKEFMGYLIDFTKTIKNWLEEKKMVESVLDKLNELNGYAAKFDNQSCTSWIEENQKTLRQSITRIDVIKKTTFIKAGYTIMEIISAAVIVLILFSKTDTFILGAATYAASSFTLVYMILLIKDMDDPFQFGENDHGVAEASLLPITDALGWLEREYKKMR